MKPKVIMIEEIGIKAAANEAAAALRSGALTIIPADAVYGAAASLEHKELPDSRKGRDRAKPIARLDDHERAVAAAFWPGPHTLALDFADGAMQEACDAGFRVPRCDFAIALLRLVGAVLPVTSANAS